ncbi:NlpC/P60 family protein [Photobacterium andalusiense]|uniref:Murein DD-endopeptidase MepS/Murein LD-carboxypeptidase n=1 Tax=Photobacterium andalusiense TaxID=2204296 RepID=A0A1Y6M9Z0_9GAMM|nr:NlpC/P60 family protein [Photobacterium andalusiense]SMY33407.1 Murein DD-endopeptidase MepS/Murein LD-carboxypeptidase precursor [Photobacterium andalusiense]
MLYIFRIIIILSAFLSWYAAASTTKTTAHTKIHHARIYRHYSHKHQGHLIHHTHHIKHVYKKRHHLTKRQELRHVRLVRHKIFHAYYGWKGTPYHFGGSSHRGIDCSAFVMKMYRQVFHRYLPRTTLGQVKLGRRVRKDQAKLGDLVFFKTGHNERHVGIYLSNGNFMNSASSRGVSISNLHHIFWKRHFWQVRRLVSI